MVFCWLISAFFVEASVEKVQNNFAIPYIICNFAAAKDVPVGIVLLFYKQQFMSNNKTVKWRRFTRASYAVFNSLHREVAIGVLSAAMLQSVGVKAAQAHNVACLQPADSIAASADDDVERSISIGDVEVLGTRVPLIESQAPRMVTVLRAADIAAASVHSINDLLEYAVGVDVRQRGEMGVQTDISVRGGTFDQITLLLNGINISSPHTGHLSADFPVSMDDIERIEVVEGPAARVFGTSAFTGVVNIVTKTPLQLPRGGESKPTALHGSLHLRGGAYGYGGGDGRITLAHQPGNVAMTHSLSGGYSRSDGATPNSDFTNTHFFYQGTIQSSGVPAQKIWKVSAQAGYSYKPYGANTFYGASSTDQWESNERWMAAVKGEVALGKVHVMPQVYWNRWNDHYQWHRGVSPGGENFHQVDVLGGAVNSWVDWALGKTSLGIEVRSDAIWSTNLGKVLAEDEYRDTGGHDGTPDRKYTRHDQRTNTSAFLEHDILLRQWTISLGVLANHNTGLDSKWRFYPGIDVAYLPARNIKLFASWNMALRMPTFTDLYYSGANIEGNSNLKPEKTNDVALGARFRPTAWDIQGQVFYSHKSDMIDWVVYKDETVTPSGEPTDPKTWIYRSGNFTLDNVGVELQAAWLPREMFSERCPLRRLSLSYAYLSEDIAYERAIVLSKYAQEYLRHKIVASADGTLFSYGNYRPGERGGSITLSLSYRWQDRVGSGNEPYGLLDGRLSWDTRHFRAYVDCTNIIGTKYYDYSFIPQPGRWLKAGIILTL